MTPELLTRQLAPILKDFVAQETKALREEISVLKSQLAGFKPPERGEKGDKGDPGLRGEKGDPGIDGKNGADGADGKDGEDGIGLAGAVIDKDGNLSITNTKGELKPLGRVVGKDGKDGVDGKNGADGKDGAQGEQGPKGDKGEPGEDGKSVDISELKAIVADLVNQKADFDPEKLAKMFPEPKAGDRGEKGEPGADGKDGIDGKDGRDGKDADTDAILKTLRDELKDMVAAIEKPKDGKDGVDGKDGAQGPKGEKGDKGDTGKDGRGVRKAYVNQSGELKVEFTDDTSDNCGVVVGPEGAAGLGFDDVRVEHDGERKFFLVFERGDERRKHGPYTVPAIIGRGIYEQGKEYEPGDAVTHRGSMWLATEKTSSVPGTQESGWALSVKKGRDGKDGKDGPKGEKGEKGRPGRDLTQMDRDGNKW